MIRPGTIGHVTSEAEDQWVWLDARIQESRVRDCAELEQDGLAHMAAAYDEWSKYDHVSPRRT